MLISAPRHELTGEDVLLQEWLRAPLFLGDGTRYYAAIEAGRKNKNTMELIVSAFDHDLWSDLWRIEINTSDEPGNSAILFTLLQDRGLHILCAESSVNTFNYNHTTSLVLSARKYSSETDYSSRERSQMDKAELTGIWRDIIAYLGDQIAFNPDATPAIKVRRFSTYKKISDEMANGKRFILNRNGDLINNSSIKLTPRALKCIYDELPGKKISYSAAVDTKDRLVRIIFFDETHPKINYCQLIANGEDNLLLTNIYKSIYSHGCNIIRNQVRPCPDKIAQELIRKATGCTPYLDQVNAYVAVDITFDISDSHNQTAWRRSINKLDRDLISQADNSSNGLFIVKRSWNNGEKKQRRKRSSAK